MACAATDGFQVHGGNGDIVDGYISGGRVVEMEEQGTDS